MSDKSASDGSANGRSASAGSANGGRSASVTAPGAQRIVLTGILAVPDTYRRVRLLLLDQREGGASDGTWPALRKAVPNGGQDYKVPYTVKSGLLTANDDGIRGEVTVSCPKHRRSHWMSESIRLRGQWVRIEATVRQYSFFLGESHRVGASLDLSMLEPLADNDAV